MLSLGSIVPTLLLSLMGQFAQTGFFTATTVHMALHTESFALSALTQFAQPAIADNSPNSMGAGAK